jgi:hypothetical protein
MGQFWGDFPGAGMGGRAVLTSLPTFSLARNQWGITACVGAVRWEYGCGCRTLFFEHPHTLMGVEWVFEDEVPLQDGATSGDVQ